MWMANLLHPTRMPSNLTGVGNTRVSDMHLKNGGVREASFWSISLRSSNLGEGSGLLIREAWFESTDRSNVFNFVVLLNFCPYS